MTWTDFHRRQQAIQAVLDHAGAHPGEPLASDRLAQTDAVFADTDELLAALQHKWTQVLIGRVELTLAEATDAPYGDRVDAVAAAWHRTAADHPVLRDVLDHHSPSGSSTYRAAIEREEWLLAVYSGLAENSETELDIVRIGAAFRRLLQVPARTDQPRNASPVPLRQVIASGG